MLSLSNWRFVRDALQSELREFKPTAASDFDVSIKMSSTLFKSPDRLSEWPFFDKNGLTVSYPAMVSLLLDPLFQEKFLKPLKSKYEQELNRPLFPSYPQALTPPPPPPLLSVQRISEGGYSQLGSPTSSSLPGDWLPLSYSQDGATPQRSEQQQQQQQQPCILIRDSVESGRDARTQAGPAHSKSSAGRESIRAKKKQRVSRVLSTEMQQEHPRQVASENYNDDDNDFSESEAEFENSANRQSPEQSPRASPVRREKKQKRATRNQETRREDFENLLSAESENIQQLPETPPHQTGKNYRGSLREQLHLDPDLPPAVEQEPDAVGSKKRVSKRSLLQ